MTNMQNSEELEEWNSSAATGLIADSAILAIYMIVGLTGNSLVVFIHKFRLKNISDDRYFIPFLAIVDLLSCLLNTSFSISINSLPLKYENKWACKAMFFLCMIFSMASAFMLVAIAVHRYLKICKPFGRQMMIKQKQIVMAVISVVSILISWPCFFFYGPKAVNNIENRNITGYRCASVRGPWSATEPLIFKTSILILAVISLIVLIVTYAFIGKVIYRVRLQNTTKYAQNVGSGCTSNTDMSLQSIGVVDENELSTQGNVTTVNFRDIKCTENKVKEPGIRFSIMFMLITLIFILSYIPKLGMMIYESKHEHFWTELSHQELGGYRFLYTFFIINNIVNPFIYGFFDKLFREEFSRMFCKCSK